MALKDSKSGTDIQLAAQLLQAGQLVGIPTETVYGLAANALDIKAVSKIFTAKNRPTFDPLIIHSASLEQAKEYVHDIPDKLVTLANTFMPGPLTLLIEKRNNIPDLVTSGLPRVALRIPSHPLVKALLEKIDFPLAAPSANPFGYISPTSAAHVLNQLSDQVAYVLDGGICQVGLESTIVGIENDEVTIYRKGGLAIEEIESIIGPVSIKPYSSSNPAAPGMLKSHYSPRKPLRLLNSNDFENCPVEKNKAYLSFQTPKNNGICKTLSLTGNMEEAAQNLFAFLRLLDEEDVEEIIAELLPEIGLGRAINDRLRRAAIEE